MLIRLLCLRGSRSTREDDYEPEHERRARNIQQQHQPTRPVDPARGEAELTQHIKKATSVSAFVSFRVVKSRSGCRVAGDGGQMQCPNFNAA